ncbi:hypothetical protein ABPG72_015550 [Tetrahymena utriculariae]
MYGNSQNQYNQQYPQNQYGQQGYPQGNTYQQPYNQYGNQQYDQQNFNQQQQNQGFQQQPMMGQGGPYYQYNEHPDSKVNKKKDKKGRKSSLSSDGDEENLGYFQQDSQNNESTGLTSDKFLRSGFVTKVYTILSAQMAVTAILCAFSMSNQKFRNFQMNNFGLMIAALVVNIICLLVLICSRDQARKVPNNYILLGVFTLCESYLVSFICGMTNPKIVFLAALFTMAIFLSLTLYACTTKSDFTTMGGTLYVIGMGLFVFGIFLIFTNNNVMHLIYATACAVLFGFYILYDTQLIIGNKSYKYSIDDYIIASLELYMDIIGLFLQLLEILQRLSGSSSD